MSTTEPIDTDKTNETNNGEVHGHAIPHTISTDDGTADEVAGHGFRTIIKTDDGTDDEVEVEGHRCFGIVRTDDDGTDDEVAGHRNVAAEEGAPPPVMR